MTESATNKRLGRGLASLIGDVGPEGPISGGTGARDIPIEFIQPNAANPRKAFSSEELDDLARSIREKGIIQPLIVRPVAGGDGSYEIVAGERRWRAAQIARLHKLPVVVRNFTDREALEIALIENIQRADLNAVEEAQGYADLIDRFKYSQEDLAGVIGKSRSHVANMMRLLKLPIEVRVLIEGGRLSAGHARALVGREDAVAVARQIVETGLNVREVEALVQQKQAGSKRRGGKARPRKDANTLALEKSLSDVLGLSVAIMTGAGERGELRLKYRTLDQLDFLCCRLKG